MTTPPGVMPNGAVPLIKSCASTRNIERGNSAVACTHEPVIDGKAVVERSSDRPSFVYTGRERPDTARGISRRIERGKRAARGSHEHTEIPAEWISRNGFKVGFGDHSLRCNG